jgi:hypothetical protein
LEIVHAKQARWKNSPRDEWKHRNRSRHRSRIRGGTRVQVIGPLKILAVRKSESGSALSQRFPIAVEGKDANQIVLDKQTLQAFHSCGLAEIGRLVDRNLTEEEYRCYAISYSFWALLQLL